MKFSDRLEDLLAGDEVDRSSVPPTMARQWAKMRSMGRLKYTVLYGVLAVGVSPAIFFAIRYHDAYSPIRLAAHLAAFPLIGLGWGIFSWEIYRRKCEPPRATTPHDDA